MSRKIVQSSAQAMFATLWKQPLRPISTNSCKASFKYSSKPLRVIDPLQPTTIDTVKADTRLNKSADTFSMIMGPITLGDNKKLIALEGARLVEDALQAGLKMDKLFLVRSLKKISPGLDYLLEHEKQQEIATGTQPEVHRVGLKLMEKWSSLTTPPGIIGIFAKPKIGNVKTVSSKEDEVPISVICDNIREPGNLGSILRSACAAGCDEVFLSPSCVDPWNIKVLRGACGAHFRTPITADITNELLGTLLSRKSRLLTPDTDQQTKKISLFICDSNVSDSRIDLPSESYRDLNFSKFSHSFLVIGGETSGISNDMIRAAKHLKESNNVELHRIRIPLANDMDSLNAANAFGIVLFEMVRQIKSNLTANNSSS